MKRIDISKWKEFRVGDLFEIVSGKGITKKEIVEHGGTLPAIQSGEEKFGLIGYIDEEYCIQKKYSMSKGECLTVARSGSSGYVSYQGKKCVVGDSAKILEPKFESNKSRLLFIRTLLLENKKKYAYKDKVTTENYGNDIILLPITPSGTPDWEFMEKYMREKEQQTASSIKALKRLTQSHKPKRIDTSNWKEFYVGKLFPKIIKPRVYHSHEVKEETSGVPYIVRSKFNNGIKYRVNRNGIVTSPKGVISFGAENASFFYQEEEWCSGRDIYYIDTRDIPSYSCRFLAVCLNRLTEKYSYNYGLFPELLKMEKILLPVTQSGTPDWELMEQYMRQVELQVKNSIIALTTPTPQIQQQGTINNYGTVNIYEK